MGTLQQQAEAMSLASPPSAGMDIIIIVTSSDKQESYWQEYLVASAGYSYAAGTKVVVVNEDWPGGAGNGLGTLYAYQKAIRKAKSLYNIDLLHEQEEGAAVAMYHTAGKGTRLAPLPGTEANNKSAVKLPAVKPDGSLVTILEAVIRQTSIYGAGRKGRLSVFWGDQIFIPSATPQPSLNHVDILACLSPLPTKEVWEEKGLSRYGLVYVAESGHAKLLEKVEYSMIQRLTDSKVLTSDGLFGTSLGSFSVSYELLCALLNEFASELRNKKGKLDSDPHLWMPLSLDEATYARLMLSKGMSELDAKQLHRRLQKVKHRLQHSHDEVFFGTIDVGMDSYWWDFGTVQNYYHNCLKLVADTPEGHAIRTFFGGNVAADNNVYQQKCDIGNGTITNSVLVGVKAKNLDANNCVIINCAFTELSAVGSLLYSVRDSKPLNMPEASVRADVFLYYPLGHIKMHSELSRDGNKDWNVRLNGNPLSYAELYLHNERDED